MKAASFFKGLGYLVMLNMLVKPLWIFGIDRQIQNVVGHQSYGAYFALLNLSIVLSFLTDAGLTNMMNQRLAAGQQLNLLQLVKLKVSMSVVYTAIVATVSYASGGTQWQLFLSVVGIQVLTSFFVLLRNIITAHQLFKTDAWLSVLDKSLMILFCAPFLYGATTYSNILFYLYIQLLCTSIAVFIALVVVIRNKFFNSNAPAENIKGILKSLLPFAVIILLMSAHSRLDAFLLERIHTSGDYQAGIYAAAYRLLDAANVMGFMFASFLVPFIARHMAQKDVVQSAVLTSRHVLMVSGIGAAVFIIAFAKDVSSLLYHNNDGDAVLVMQLCMVVLPAYIMIHIYGSVLTAVASLKSFINIMFIAVAVNALLNVLLIPMYGAAGCCTAAIASQFICAALLYMRATKITGISFSINSMLAYIGFAAILALIFYAGKQFNLAPFALLLLIGAVALALLLFNIGRIKKYFVLLR